MNFETATIWHKDNNNSYTKTVCTRCFVCPSKTASLKGTDITAGNNMTIRCFTFSKFSVKPGDRICRNFSISKTPPENALIIRDIKENFNSSARLRHYRFECV